MNIPLLPLSPSVVENGRALSGKPPTPDDVLIYRRVSFSLAAHLQKLVRCVISYGMELNSASRDKIFGGMQLQWADNSGCR